VVSIAVVSLFVAGTGNAAAISGTSGSGSAGTAQYPLAGPNQPPVVLGEGDQGEVLPDRAQGGPAEQAPLDDLVVAGETEAGGESTSAGLPFTGLALLTLRAVSGGRWAGVSLRALALALAITTLHGMSVEVEQMFVPTRFAEWRDVGNDVIGALAGLTAAWAWGKLFKQ